MTTFQLILLGLSLYFAYRFFNQITDIEQEVEKKEENKQTRQKALTGKADGKPSFETMMQKADEAFNDEKIDQALYYLDRAHDLQPNNLETLQKFAFVTAHSRDHTRAIELYQEALQLDENDDQTHSALASLYHKIDDNDKAAEHYKQALLIDANYAPTYYNYANLLQDIGKIKEAIHHYKIALKIDPELSVAQEEIEKLEREV
jgi:tetratricopeptide (TPR) repeat protein